MLKPIGLININLSIKSCIYSFAQIAIPAPKECPTRVKLFKENSLQNPEMIEAR